MADQNQSPDKGLTLHTGFGFKTIWLLESLPDGQYHTGRELHRTVLLPRQREDPGLLVEFVDIPNRAALFGALEKIRSTLASTGQVPLIHLETHGDKKGVSLKSGEHVLYEELCPVLRKINVLAQNNLFVVVAACNGVYLSFILSNSLTDPSPFWGVCGPSVEISAGDVIDGYSAFYGEALVSADMNAAIGRLKQAIPHHADKFNIWNSEYLFMLAFRHYLHVHCNPKAIDQRAESIVKEARAGLGTALDAEQCDRYVRERLGTEDGQKREFERMITRFFMHDIYPRNPSLPSPSFEDMRRIRLVEKDAQQATGYQPIILKPQEGQADESA